MNKSQVRRSLSAVVAGALVFSGLTVLAPSPVAAAAAGSTVRASLTPAGGQIAEGVDDFGAISGDGNVVAFVTTAPLVAADTNAAVDLYRRNLTTGAVDLVTIDVSGAAAGVIAAGSYDIDLDQDGSHVAFESFANNLVAGDVDGARDIFVRTFGATGAATTRQANVNNDGSRPVGSGANATGLSISADGSRVAFMSYSSLVDATGASTSGITIRDFTAAQTIHVANANTAGSKIAISGDGSSVAFLDYSPAQPYALRLFRGGTIVAINDSPGGNTPIAFVAGPDAVSFDGMAVAFTSAQPDLVAGDTNAKPDAFVYRVTGGTVTRVSVTAAGGEGTGDTAATGISDDGSRIVFASSSDELAPGASGYQCYVRDTTAGTTDTVSKNSSGVISNSGATNPRISRDGVVVSFTSPSSNLDTADTNGQRDIYVHTLGARRPPIGDLTLTVAPSAQKAGVSDIPTSQIDLGLLPLLGGEIESAPLRSSPLRSSPLRSSPLRSSPLRSSPLRSSPLRSSPLRSSPLRSSPVLAAASQLPPMPLSTVPLLLDGGWAPRLIGTNQEGAALQAVTLQQVIDLANQTQSDGTTPKFPQLASLTLADIDLTSTPLRSSPLQGFLFAGPTLEQLSPVTTTDWCVRVPVTGCNAATWTLLDLVLAGATSSQLSFVSYLPVSEATLAGSPIAQYDVGSTDPTAAGLGAIPVGSLPAGMVAPGCTLNGAACATLADAVKANGIVTDPTNSAFGRILADDLLVGYATFGGLVRAVVDPTKISYAGVDLYALVGQAPFESTREVTYTATATVACAAPPGMELSVLLPTGFRYVKGSSVLQSGSNAPVTSDPAEGAPPSEVFLVNRDVQLTARAFSNPRPLFRWPVADGCGGATTGRVDMSLTFDATPGVYLGPATSDAWLSSTDGTSGSSVADAAPVNVGDALEPNDSVAAAKTLTPGTLYVSHISGAADIDTYKLPAGLPAGTRVTAVLSHLPADFDLFLDGPVAAPLRSSPLRSSPLRSSPIEDLGAGGDAGGGVVEPDTLQDIPLRSSDLSQSTTAGTEDEQVTTVLTAATTAGDPATLAVTHHLGSSSPLPYMLQVTTQTPPVLHCATTSSPFAGTGGAAGSLPSLSGLTTAQKAEKKTLFLVNAKRLGDSSSMADADAVLAKLGTLSSRPEVGGVVLPVEGNSAVASAYATWDANRCNPEAANNVVRAIGAVVDTYAAQLPQLRYITFVGDDDIVPFARIPDGASVSNQLDYYPEVVFNNVDNPISAAFGLGYVLSDNPLLAKDGIDFLGHQLDVPSFAGGRLVETPQEIMGQIDQYAAQPHILLSSTLVTGYDFLSDAATAIDSALAANLATNRAQLNDETWDKGALTTELGKAPAVAAINGHYDHSNALPAKGNSSQSLAPELFTSTDLLNSAVPPGALLFTLGCQGGLSVPGRAWASANTEQAKRLLDFAQAASQKKANGYLGNTGFGYGDTVAVAYSERFLELFTKNLNGTMTLGQAVSKAKQDYLKEGLVGVYDEKVLNEATFYGLPFVTVGASGSAAPAPSAPAAGPATSDTLFGTPVRSFSKTLTYASVSTPRGGFYQVPGEQPLVEHFRPIQPAVSEDLPAPPAGSQLGDVWFTDLTSLPDEAATDPVFSAPTVDRGAFSPEPLVTDVNFPVSLGTVTPSGTVALFPGQYRSGSTPGQGTQLRFSKMDYKVFYPTSLDAVRPSFTAVDAASSSSGTTFRLGVQDAQHVAVLYRPVNSSDWTSAQLTQVSPGVWAGQVGLQVAEYLAQAVNDGRVGTTRGKGLNYVPSPEQVTLTNASGTGPPAGTTSWYREPVKVSVAGGDYEASVDGGAFQPLPLTISTDGAHRVDYRQVGTTETTTIAVPIDQVKPTVTITNPSGGRISGSQAQYSCADALSGIESCTAMDSTTLDNSPGTHEFRVKAVDRAGNEYTRTETYQGLTYTFEGFFTPVDNIPTVNLVRAGNGVPVKFRLRNNGTVVTDTAVVTSIKTVTVACAAGATVDPVEEATASVGGGLVYDPVAQRFQYNWKTDKGSVGCRKLTFTFADGTSRYALFQFKQ